MEEYSNYRDKLEKYLNDYKIFDPLKSSSKILFQVGNCNFLIKKYGAFTSVKILSSDDEDYKNINNLIKFQFTDFEALDYILQPDESDPLNESKNFGKKLLELFFKKSKGMISFGLKEITCEDLLSINRTGFLRLLKNMDLKLDNI